MARVTVAFVQVSGMVQRKQKLYRTRNNISNLRCKTAREATYECLPCSSCQTANQTFLPTQADQLQTLVAIQLQDAGKVLLTP